MTTTALALFLAGAFAVALFVTVWRFAAYAKSHPHTATDLEGARKDSRTRSRSSLLGDIAQHLAPLWPEFLELFDPRDAYFLGKPIDFIVFDGLEEGNLRNIVFVEVKSTVKASLTEHERAIRRYLDDVEGVGFLPLYFGQGTITERLRLKND